MDLYLQITKQYLYDFERRCIFMSQAHKTISEKIKVYFEQYV